MAASQAEKLKYRIGGMDCASCVQKIENAVRRLPGVDEVGVSLAAGTMTVQPNGTLTKGAIEQQVKALGYSIAPATAKNRAPVQPPGHDHDHDHHGHGDHDGHDHGGHSHD